MRDFLSPGLGNRGLSIVETMIATGIVALGATGLIAATQMSNDYGERSNSVNALMKLRSKLLAELRSSDALSRLGELNGNVCLRTRSGCAAPDSTTWQPLLVVDSTAPGGDVRLSDPTSVSSGFQLDLRPCRTFPTGNCPIRMNAEWRAFCSSPATCDVAQIKVRTRLVLDESLQRKVNPSLYEFDVSVGQVLGTYEQSCSSLGGLYIPGEPPRCAYPNRDCPPDSAGNAQVVVGYQRSQVGGNRVLCSPLPFPNGSCAPGQVMIGVDTAGQVICRAQQCPPPFQAMSPPCPSVVVPFDCQREPWRPECVASPPSGDGGGGDGGCGGDGGGGDGCGP